MFTNWSIAMVIRRLLALFGIIVLSASSLLAQGGYQGKDFWVAFPQNARAENTSGLSLVIYISSAKDVSGSITENRTERSFPFTIEAGKTFTFKADSINQTDLTGIHTSSLHITSSNDISVIVISHRRASTDSYAAIPTLGLGNNYIVNGYDAFGSESTFSTQFDAIATEDNTSVTITYPQRQSIASTQKRITLMKGDIYHESSAKYKEYNRDLSGTVVTSDKPMAFITGSQCAQVPKDKNFCDVLLEMIPPVDMLGNEYVIPELPERKASSIRVMATKPNTKVLLNDKQVAVLSTGSYYQNDSLVSSNVIQTSEPSYVYQYSQSAGTDGFSDPDLILIPPTDRYVTTTTITIPKINVLQTALKTNHYTKDTKRSSVEEMVNSLSDRHDIVYVNDDTIIFKRKGDTSNLSMITVLSEMNKEYHAQNPIPNYQPPAIYESENGWHHWVTIITESPTESNVTINDKPLAPTSFRQVFRSRFYVLHKNLSPGSYKITSQKPAVFFSSGYGVAGDNYDSYGHNCGMNLVDKGK